VGKGKKSKGKNYTSKEGRNSVSRSLVKAVRSDRAPLEVMLNKLSAWKKGQNPWITVTNPNSLETNRRFIKVRARQEWKSRGSL
jgi:hypothetical protein